MFSIPAHHQRDPAKAPGQSVNEDAIKVVAYKPVHGSRPDAPIKTLGDYVKVVEKAEHPCYMDPKLDWVGFDFDRTLARYDNWSGPADVGAPIPPMLTLLKKTMREGVKVKIFTARVWPIIEMIPGEKTIWDPRADSIDKARVDGAHRAVLAIIGWCKTHIGEVIPITCIKDIHCALLFDDIARQVLPNQGIVVK